MLKDSSVVYHHFANSYEWGKTQFVIGSELPKEELMAELLNERETKPPYFIDNEIHFAESRPAYIENGTLHLGPIMSIPPEIAATICMVNARAADELERIKKYARSKGVLL